MLRHKPFQWLRSIFNGISHVVIGGWNIWDVRETTENKACNELRTEMVVSFTAFRFMYCNFIIIWFGMMFYMKLFLMFTRLQQNHLKYSSNNCSYVLDSAAAPRTLKCRKSRLYPASVKSGNWWSRECVGTLQFASTVSFLLPRVMLHIASITFRNLIPETCFEKTSLYMDSACILSHNGGAPRLMSRPQTASFFFAGRNRPIGFFCTSIQL